MIGVEASFPPDRFVGPSAGLRLVVQASTRASIRLGTL